MKYKHIIGRLVGMIVSGMLMACSGNGIPYFADLPDEVDLFLTVSPGKLSYSATGGDDRFSILSNTPWTVTSNALWCNVNTTIGAGNAEIVVSVTENNDFTGREAVVIVTGAGMERTVNIVQKGQELYLEVDKSSLSFAATGGEDSFAINTNAPSTDITSNQSWCKVNYKSGVVTVTVTENPDTQKRDATITVKGEVDARNSITRNVTITQQARIGIPGEDDNPLPSYSRNSK